MSNIYDSVTELIGRTPLLRLHGIEQSCYAIGEGWYFMGKYQERLAAGYGCRDRRGALAS